MGAGNTIQNFWYLGPASPLDPRAVCGGCTGSGRVLLLYGCPGGLCASFPSGGEHYGSYRELQKDSRITCENFEKLVKSGFYDGLTFHRVIPGFMIQGGCPLGNGTGGPGWKIKGEFAANGVANPIKHTRGVVSMARAADPKSAGSQFFIMHKDALDGQYAAFGKVVAGMDVVDRRPAAPTGTISPPAPSA